MGFKSSWMRLDEDESTWGCTWSVHEGAKERNPSHKRRRRGSWKAMASALASAAEQVADPQNE
jgi:hypothetical protein